MVNRTPRLYFSFRSPFSWMAIEVLRRKVPDILDRLEVLPFWDPDPTTAATLAAAGADVHYVPMSKAKHLYLLQDTKRLSQRLGLSMRWPVDVDPCWEVPHLAWLLTRRMGLAEPFYDAVVTARWGRGENICEPAVIAGLAEGVGVDPHLLACAAQQPELRAEGVRSLAEAWHDDVFGIPYLRIGRHRFWGLDRVADFLDLYLPTLSDGDRTSPAAPPTLDDHQLATVGPYDTDTAGGCG